MNQCDALNHLFSTTYSDNGSLHTVRASSESMDMYMRSLDLPKLGSQNNDTQTPSREEPEGMEEKTEIVEQKTTVKHKSTTKTGANAARNIKMEENNKY